jgi:hypothetical protein
MADGYRALQVGEKTLRKKGAKEGLQATAAAAAHYLLKNLRNTDQRSRSSSKQRKVRLLGRPQKFRFLHSVLF